MKDLLVHVGIVHNKLDEVMGQMTKSSEETGDKHQLDLDLELGSDEDLEDQEVSQGDIEEEEEEEEEDETKKVYQSLNTESFLHSATALATSGKV